MQNQSGGIFLIELLIASLLGLLLLSILFTIYMASQKNFQLQSAINQIQIRAETAVETIANEIKQAGFIGCAKLTDANPVAEEITLSNKIILRPHELFIRNAAQHGEAILSINDRKRELIVSRHRDVKPNTLLVLSDCLHAEVVQVVKVVYGHSEQKLALADSLKYDYTHTAEISQLERKHVYVGKSHGLYMKEMTGRAKRVVDGVDNLEVAEVVSDGKRHAIKFAVTVSVASLTKTWYGYVAV